MKIRTDLTPKELLPRIRRMWDLSAGKLRAIEKSHNPAKGAPVYTVRGRYTSRGWTEWTQGFQYGSELLQFEATGAVPFLEAGRRHTVKNMAPHLTHFGVHDHGFNNVSTYGNLLRMMREGSIPADPWERRLYELALKCSGAVQARRWTPVSDGGGFIHSFNGPHSLFADTIRSLRALALSHRLGHVLLAENDRRVSLLDRLLQHARATAQYNVYYGEGRDAYDVRGRVAHESLFNAADGQYRCPGTQQGFSPFSTWTRGLAWVLCGYAEQLEFLSSLPPAELRPHGGRAAVEEWMLKAALATADFYIGETAADGIPYWDTGAPNLHRLGDYRAKPSDPFNRWEPVDSSAAAIAAQGLLRLGRFLSGRRAFRAAAGRCWHAGLHVLHTLLDEPYLSAAPDHQGLLLHSVYHRPRGWDYVPRGRRVPCGESSQWGDYHLRELALLVQREAEGESWLTFFNEIGDPAMIVADLERIEGRRYPARRRTQNLVGGLSPIQARAFAAGFVTLEPRGGQVPWHTQEQEEVYFVLEGRGEMCLGAERQEVRGGQAVHIPGGVFHQITNLGDAPLRMLYIYGPAGDVAHWRQELSGTLPRAGVDAPPLPPGAQPQCTEKPKE